MDIGTAKPRRRSAESVRHQLVDIVDPDEAYNAGRFARDARAAVAAVISRGRIPLLVGGTGLYLKALSEGLVNAPPADEAVRAELSSEAARAGLDLLHRRLAGVDPRAAAAIPRTTPSGSSARWRSTRSPVTDRRPWPTADAPTPCRWASLPWPSTARSSTIASTSASTG